MRTFSFKSGWPIAVAFFFLGIILGMFVPSSYREFFNNSPDKSSFYEKLCLKNNGIWLDQYRECEGPTLGKEFCLRNRGEFLECQSPCRHDPDETICQTVCINVCRF